MNTPNKLTLARMIATPFFMAAMLFDFPYHYLVALILVAAAAVTDAIDGSMEFPRKPAPDALLYLMEKNQMNPAETLMVGDRDIENGTVSPRHRAEGDLGAMSFDEFAALVKDVVDSKAKK